MGEIFGNENNAYEIYWKNKKSAGLTFFSESEKRGWKSKMGKAKDEGQKGKLSKTEVSGVKASEEKWDRDRIVFLDLDMLCGHLFGNVL